MQNQHLTSFKVENFKKFNSHEVKDIGQCNLIVGDNNVEETCMLEALLVDNYSYDKAIELLHYTLCLRNNHYHEEYLDTIIPLIPNSNYFLSLKNQINKENINVEWKQKNKIKKYSFQVIELNNLSEFEFNFEKKHYFNYGRPDFWIKIFEDDVFREIQFMYYDDFVTKHDHSYLPLIKLGQSFSRDLNIFYSEKIGVENGTRHMTSMDDPNFFIYKMKEFSFEDKKYFIQNLIFFLDGIEEIGIKMYNKCDDILPINVKENEDYIPFTYFVDGFNIFIRYLLEIPKNKNKKIMINEFGEGVQYSILKDFCKNILLICEKEEVQLFATTQSKECIKAFCQADIDLNEQENIRLINLEEGIEEKIYATSYSFENIEA